jgi:hypothetical protein
MLFYQIHLKISTSRENKMNKYLHFLPIIALILLFTSCSSFKTPEKIVKLNTNEYNKLVAAAKNTLLGMPDSKVSKTEKKYIKENSPEFKTRYNGNKKGKYTIRWEIPTGKTLQIFGEGNMLDFRDSFERVSIVSIKVNGNN